MRDHPPARLGDRLTYWLSTTHTVTFSLFATAVAFSTYFAMYAFRKPFTVGTFSDEFVLLGRAFSLKTLLVISQTLGYAISKFAGIKTIVELPPQRRAVTLLMLIAVSEAALLAFGVLPPVGKIVAIFVNGLPLGMIWGLVFSFLEGRRASDALGAGLSASYILASGAVKSIGRWLMTAGVSESWMPFATGALFLAPIAATTWLLSRMPPPNRTEAALRTERRAMNASDRHGFFLAFAPGLTLITLMAMVLTAFRDVRDNFAREIWDALGFADAPEVFTLSEVPVTVAVLLALGLVVVIRSDRRAFLLQLSLMLGGMAVILLSTLAFDVGALSGAWWMVCVGIGLYVAYVPPGCFLFDRLIGATRFAGTAVFMIFVTDAFGYAASVGVYLYREFFQPQLDWLAFLRVFAYATGLIGCAAFGAALLYFAAKTRRQQT